MTRQTFPAIYGADKNQRPICACGAGFADRMCDFNWRDRDSIERVCDLKLCERCAVAHFGRDLCAGHAEWEVQP